MLQGLLISYWDLLFHRQIATPVAKWAYDQGAYFTDKRFLSFKYLCYFIVGYLYLYLTLLMVNLPKFWYGMVNRFCCFWLRIKTQYATWKT
jgi:hypothetical protein